jgi:hypothetical protein
MQLLLQGFAFPVKYIHAVVKETIFIIEVDCFLCEVQVEAEETAEH